jgi:hypothetical protein
VARGAVMVRELTALAVLTLVIVLILVLLGVI